MLSYYKSRLTQTCPLQASENGVTYRGIYSEAMATQKRINKNYTNINCISYENATTIINICVYRLNRK